MTMPVRPVVPPPDAWSFPVPETHKLANGMTVLVFDRPGQHVVSVGVCLNLPLTAEPRNIEGVASLTAQCLDQGCERLPGTDFADAIERCGAVFEASVTQATTDIRLDVPSSQIRQALPLLVEALAHPQLIDNDVNRMRALSLARVEHILATSQGRAEHVFLRSVLQRKYRASRMRGGEIDTLTAVQGEDVRAFHRTYYTPDRATVVIAGAITADVQAVLDIFSTWTAGPHVHTRHETPKPRKPHHYLVDRPGSVQADVRMGHFSINRRDPQWAAFQVGSYALGGAFLSRLNKVLREERGYTYGVNIGTLTMRNGAYTSIQGSFGNAMAADALALIPELIDTSRRPITAEEVQQARDYLMGVQPLRYSTAGGVCDGVMTLLGSGLDSTFVEVNRTATRLVTPDLATRAVETHLPPNDLSLVIVGDASVLADALVERGFDISVIELDQRI